MSRLPRTRRPAFFLLALLVAPGGCREAERTEPPAATKHRETPRPEVAGPAEPSGAVVERTPEGHLVTWTESRDPLRLGYNVYRRCGGDGARIRLNAECLLVARYLDTTAVDGFEYAWEVEVVDARGASRLAPAAGGGAWR